MGLFACLKGIRSKSPSSWEHSKDLTCPFWDNKSRRDQNRAPTVDAQESPYYPSITSLDEVITSKLLDDIASLNRRIAIRYEEIKCTEIEIAKLRKERDEKSLKLLQKRPVATHV